MVHNDQRTLRKPWSIAFVAEAEEAASLRRLMRLHLGLWGLPGVIETAQLCVTEMLSNVITHVGPGTPTTLSVSMNGGHVRIEIQDPDTRALPTLLQAGAESEGGRGMALIDAMAVRWGVEPRADRKVTWCELAVEPGLSPSAHGDPHMSGAEELLDVHGGEETPDAALVGSLRLSLARAEEAAIDIIADLLHWLHTHGRDADDFLDRVQTHFEADARSSA
ncbi:ATP-binding protein [Streptomyces sp. ME08-AFT2]|uniref:ATP-binding protein n=1 Tax=Streptomyces sp. ME08-AFT2 TaxID=3028683 RepID=UPI0029B18DD0|nr:ATP-binding protein [Streptomyces sp. ME08-AFT2]MDX3310753.1 ATP-binding protein [Streptomyces sp. ME08-AFT2]